jgi:hypothetical protein
MPNLVKVHFRPPLRRVIASPGGGGLSPARARRKALLAVTLLAAALLAGACGYRLDAPHLPDNASRLAVGVIQNRTATGELDIRLQDKLRTVLLRHPSVMLTSPEFADLVLDVDLATISIARTRNLTATSLSGISYTLAGAVSLYDRRKSRFHFSRVPVSASARLDFDTPIVETPAIRDEGLDELLDNFARQVEALLMSGF